MLKKFTRTLSSEKNGVPRRVGIRMLRKNAESDFCDYETTCSLTSKTVFDTASPRGNAGNRIKNFDAAHIVRADHEPSDSLAQKNSWRLSAVRSARLFSRRSDIHCATVLVIPRFGSFVVTARLTTVIGVFRFNILILRSFIIASGGGAFAANFRMPYYLNQQQG